MTPYDPAPPVFPPGGETGSAAGHPAFKRSGSQKRKRDRTWRIALTEEEEAIAIERATRSGLSRSSYGRAVLLGAPGPRAKRTPTLHAQLFGDGIVALNRAGNVANQIAHRLNAGGAITLAGECAATLAEIRDAARAIRDAVGRKDRDDNQGEPAQ